MTLVYNKDRYILLSWTISDLEKRKEFYKNEEWWSIYEFLLCENKTQGEVWECVKSCLKPKKIWISHFESIEPLLNPPQGVLTKFGYIPQEIIFYIVEFLPIDDFIETRLVCKCISNQIVNAYVSNYFLSLTGMEKDGLFFFNEFYLICFVHICSLSKQDKQLLNYWIQFFYHFKFNCLCFQKTYQENIIRFMKWFSDFYLKYDLCIEYGGSFETLSFLKKCNFVRFYSLCIYSHCQYSTEECTQALKDFNIYRMYYSDDYFIHSNTEYIIFLSPFVFKHFNIEKDKPIDLFIQWVNQFPHLRIVRFISPSSSLFLYLKQQVKKTHPHLILISENRTK